MKRFLIAVAISMLIYACSKSNLNSSSIASQLVGNWKVYESVDQSSISQWHVGNDSFYSTTFKATDTTFGIVQSNRLPVPAWVGSGPFSADTLYFNPTDNYKLFNSYQGEIGSYSKDKDTLNFKYIIEGPLVSSPWGPNGSTYSVSQQWVRQKQ